MHPPSVPPPPILWLTAKMLNKPGLTQKVENSIQELIRVSIQKMTVAELALSNRNFSKLNSRLARASKKKRWTCRWGPITSLSSSDLGMTLCWNLYILKKQINWFGETLSGRWETIHGMYRCHCLYYFVWEPHETWGWCKYHVLEPLKSWARSTWKTSL